MIAGSPQKNSTRSNSLPSGQRQLPGFRLNSVMWPSLCVCISSPPAKAIMDQIVKAPAESFDQMTLGKACDVSARKRDGLAGDVLGFIRDDDAWQLAAGQPACACRT